jgi:putative ABC transport system permease protein
VIWATIMMALREIRRNGLRSILTMLGVVIGVGAVIALVSVGRGATAKVTEDIGKLGKNLLTISAGTFSRGGGGAGISAQPLRIDDANAIRREILGVDAVAAAAASSAQVVFGNSNQRTSVTGSDNSFFEVRGYVIDKGRLFSRAETQSGAAACIIGATVRTNLFQKADPVGSTIRVGSIACQVVGLLVAKGQAGMGQDQDDLVVMPMRAVQRRITGNDNIQSIFVAAKEGEGTGVVAERLRGLLRQRRHRGEGLDDDFTIRDMAEIAETVTGGQLGGGRHRHHEHHAGLGDRANARDWDSLGDWRVWQRGDAAVFARGYRAVDAGRHHRYLFGPGWLVFCGKCPVFAVRAGARHRGVGVRVFGSGWRGVRVLAGAQGRKSRPYRGASS